jgi:hypothetical protein
MSRSNTVKIGRWKIECDLADGARIGQLSFDGVDLLTTKPADFLPPKADYGRYETRPVYGYDDCFPTVEACGQWPDHGELCWLRWSGTPVACSVASELSPLQFTRRLDFEDNRLRWSFAVENSGDTPYPVQHVMHPLMPVEEIDTIELPAGEGYDANQVAAELLALPSGNARMLFLKNVTDGLVRVGLRRGLQLTVCFPTNLFPTLGIWWNNQGYPDESGLRRSECAFEPVPGPDSKLNNGTTLSVPAQGRIAWHIDWEFSCR